MNRNQNVVEFRPKSFGQKNDCINRGRGYDCANPSILEAFVIMGKGVEVQVQCCADERCKRLAAALALIAKKVFNR